MEQDIVVTVDSDMNSALHHFGLEVLKWDGLILDTEDLLKMSLAIIIKGLKNGHSLSDIQRFTTIPKAEPVKPKQRPQLVLVK